MKEYEAVYIFHPSLTEDQVNEKLDTFHALLAAPTAPEIAAVDHWGIRQLAYQVKGQRQGYYVVSQFTAEPAGLTALERALKLDEDLLRSLIVLSEGEPTSGVSILAEVPESVGRRDSEDREDDDDEDDEEEEEVEEGDGQARGEASPPEFTGGRGRRRRIEGPPIELLNYKDVSTLSRFITEQGKILPKRTTKVSARFQRQLGRAVKRARYLALLPYVQKHDR